MFPIISSAEPSAEEDKVALTMSSVENEDKSRINTRTEELAALYNKMIARSQ